MTRGELERRILDWIGEGVDAADDARFEELALGLFALQYESGDAYRLDSNGQIIPIRQR